ncbi:MAG TPA: signal recognition particle-docking protein FtsY [Epulopiscium sp.]|nr:signal recognition particle-docking protein FtsY [Candidatus Epulonipiscium sp.]
MAFFKKLFGKKEKNTEDNIVETPVSVEVVEEPGGAPETEVELEVEVEPEVKVDPEIEPEVEIELEVEVESELEVEVEPEIEAESKAELVSEPKEKKLGFFSKLVQGLTKTRDNILEGVDSVLKSFTKIDEELYEELEEALIMADLGVSTTMEIMEALKIKVKEDKIIDPAALKDMIVHIITDMISQGDHSLMIEKGTPTVLLVIGVNGVGKTTTIGKLAHQIKGDGNKVLIAAADTFRAAAIEQLEIWGDRSGVDVIKQHEGADPAAVIYDALQAAKARKTDVLICDTAGRLHNKTNLMKELEKIFKVIAREYPEANKEVLLVLDATTGQNAISQVKQFKEVADITGIVLTKLDGTAKGGIVVGIHSSMNIPVKFIGVGEGIDDLQPFDPQEFSRALFGN